MSENGPGLETYWGPKPLLTEQSFMRVVEDHVAGVVFEPYLGEGPKGEKALGRYEEIAHLDDGYGQSAELYKIKISEDQDPVEQQKTFLHEVLHIYLGGLREVVAREKRPPDIFEEYLKREEAQAEAEAQRFYSNYPDLVRRVFNRFTSSPVMQDVTS